MKKRWAFCFPNNISLLFNCEDEEIECNRQFVVVGMGHCGKPNNRLKQTEILL